MPRALDLSSSAPGPRRWTLCFRQMPSPTAFTTGHGWKPTVGRHLSTRDSPGMRGKEAVSRWRRSIRRWTFGGWGKGRKTILSSTFERCINTDLPGDSDFFNAQQQQWRFILKNNTGGIDRGVRIVIGLAGLGAGVALGSWWGALGLIPLVTGTAGWCPAYRLLKISTSE